MNQAHGNAGIGGVKQRPLALDQIPMVGIVGGGQPLGRAGNEIGDHGVNRHAVAGNKNAGLAGGAKIGLQLLRLQLGLDRQRGVHLADRAIGADGEQALAGAAFAVADAEAARGMAHIE